MKTEMRIKTGDWLAQTKVNSGIKNRRFGMDRNKLPVGYRGAACLLLLSLLAAGSYLGARPQMLQTTSAPVVQVSLTESEASEMGYEEIRAQHDADRNREIALLDSVINHEAADDETKKAALAQKTELARRMEMESAIITALAHMGIDKAAALCGAGIITLIIPENEIHSEDDTIRIIDAAAAIAQMDASEVKIILAKK